MTSLRIIATSAGLFLGQISSTGQAHAQWGPRSEYMHSFWGGMGWIGMLFPLLILIILVLILLLIVRRVLHSSRSRSQINVSDSRSGKAMEILKERYAGGEIDRKEFEQKKQDLS
ncbi:MAG: SHOCT domain-containing protein [Desulfonatronovibrio sp.]